MSEAVEPSTFWSGRSVAVTGAAGFIGAHVTGALVDAGAVVTALVRGQLPSDDIVAAWRDRVDIVQGLAQDGPCLARLLHDAEVRSVCHLAAQSQVRAAHDDPVGTFEANIAGAWTVLEACRRAESVEDVVLASSVQAYGSQATFPYTEDMPLRADHPYDVSKACSDMLATTYAHTYGLNVCVTRSGNIFGPGDRNWGRLIPGSYRALLRGERPTIRSDGTMIRDYLYVEDLAALYLRLMEAMHADHTLKGQAFNVASGRPMSVLDMLALVKASIGSDVEPDIIGEASGEIDEEHLSSEKARRALGWEPRHSIEEALDLTAAWYRKEILGT